MDTGFRRYDNQGDATSRIAPGTRPARRRAGIAGRRRRFAAID